MFPIDPIPFITLMIDDLAPYFDPSFVTKDVPKIVSALDVKAPLQKRDTKINQFPECSSKSKRLKPADRNIETIDA